MALTEYEIFFWKHGLHVFGLIMLLTVAYIHYSIQRQIKEHDEFMKHLHGE